MRTEEDVESGRTHVGAGPGPASVGTSVARRLDLGGSPRAPRAWYASCMNIPPEALLLATAASLVTSMGVPRGEVPTFVCDGVDLGAVDGSSFPLLGDIAP